jgi:hypothetical protein
MGSEILDNEIDNLVDEHLQFHECVSEQATPEEAGEIVEGAQFGDVGDLTNAFEEEELWSMEQRARGNYSAFDAPRSPRSKRPRLTTLQGKGKGRQTTLGAFGKCFLRV